MSSSARVAQPRSPLPFSACVTCLQDEANCPSPVLDSTARAGRERHPLKVLASLAVLALPVAAAAAAPPERPPRSETPQAREQARLCERLDREDGAAACRAALSLGIGPARRRAVRELLAKHLVRLEKWDELADLFREDVRLDPADPAAWQRLGSTLLFALGQPAEAIAALEQAVRLAPRDAAARLDLGLALASVRRSGEAVAALEEALRLDPTLLDGRPAARAGLDAARAGRPWP